MNTLAQGDVSAYYEAAMVALGFLEAQRPTGRRFGAEADARWKAFGGDLKAVDRIELLIRDADAQWARSLGARTVFDLKEVAEDDAFGPAWPGIDPVDAASLWKQRPEVTGSLRAALVRAAEAWAVTPAACAVEPVGPSDKLVVVGPGAVVATAEAFAAGADLDWSEQVVAVATPPAHRQLAAMVGALLHAPRACRLVAAGAAEEPALAGWRWVVSDDAHADDVAWAERTRGA